MITTVTTDTFTEVVLDNPGPVLVDFWAPWCGPCKALAPTLEAIAADHPGLTVVKLDVDDNPEIAAEHQVLSIPTLILFHGGEPAATLTGAKSRAAILDALKTWL